MLVVLSQSKRLEGAGSVAAAASGGSKEGWLVLGSDAWLSGSGIHRFCSDVSHCFCMAKPHDRRQIPRTRTTSKLGTRENTLDYWSTRGIIMKEKVVAGALIPLIGLEDLVPGYEPRNWARPWQARACHAPDRALPLRGLPSRPNYLIVSMSRASLKRHLGICVHFR